MELEVGENENSQFPFTSEEEISKEEGEILEKSVNNNATLRREIKQNLNPDVGTQRSPGAASPAQPSP